MGGTGAEGGSVRYLIGKSAATSGFIAGLIATHVATVAGLWFAGAKLPKFDFNALNGYLYLGFPTNSAEVAAGFVIGGVIHYVNGILWGVIFALVIHPLMGATLKQLAPLNPRVNYMKGLFWGWTLWIISSTLWMPLVIGSIGIPVGAFLTNFGTVGYQATVTNLFWHTVYGLNLGLLFSPVAGGGTKPMWTRTPGMR